MRLAMPPEALILLPPGPLPPISPRRRSAMLGELDQEKDATTDLEQLRAAPINAVVY